MELQKISNISPASFEPQKKEDSISVKMIVSIIKSSIENQKAITLYDIRMLHAEYALKTLRNGVGYGWLPNLDFPENTQKVWRRSKTVEEFFITHSYPQLSVTWFKQNLGAAILKGRILAIPVIEIEY